MLDTLYISVSGGFFFFFSSVLLHTPLVYFLSLRFPEFRDQKGLALLVIDDAEQLIDSNRRLT